MFSRSLRISWGAVIAGAVVALAIALMLNALGAGAGVGATTTIDATGRDSPSASSFGIGTAIRLLVSNLIGLGVGGYVDTAASSASIAAFSIFAVMLLGAIAVVFGARRGTRNLLTFRSAPSV